MTTRHIPPALGFALVAGLAAFALAGFSPALLNDADTYWHIRAGQWMISRGTVLRTDPFSYSFANAPWHTQEWLSEILMAEAYRFGWQGLQLLFAVAAGSAAAIVGFFVRSRVSRLAALLIVSLGLCCVTPSLLARPHILALPLLSCWTAGLTCARETDRAPSWWLLAVITLWANLHASFAFGLMLALGLSIEACFDRQKRKRALICWGAFLALSVVFALLTPFAIEGLVFPLRLSFMPALSHIGEWQPTDFSHVTPFEIAILATACLVLSRRVPIPPIRLLLIFGIALMAISHSRHQMLFGIVAAILIAPCVARIWPSKDESSGSAAAIGAAIAIVALVVLRLSLPVIRHDDRMSPVSAVAHIPGALRALPVLNDYSYGGYLIFQQIHPFIDSRADLYGERFLERYAAITAADSQILAQTLSDYHIGWTIFPANSPVVKRLDRMKAWRRYYADAFVVVHIRKTTDSAIGHGSESGYDR